MVASFGFVKEDRVVVMHIVENPDSQNVNKEKNVPDNFFLLRVSVLGVQGYLPKVIVTWVPSFSISSNNPCAPIAMCPVLYLGQTGAIEPRITTDSQRLVQ